MLKGGADHCTFLNANIPAILISTGISGYYHRPTDDISTINFPGMLAISNYAKEILCSLNRRKNVQDVLR